MTKKNHWKQLAALLMSAVLLVPAPMASAAETAGTQSEGQQEDIGWIVMEENRAADADGFEIEDGVLNKYTGEAKEVVIPDGVTSIGNQAFYFCSSLTSITIPNSVISIEEQAFYFCKSLAGITIPDSVTSIGNRAFEWCSTLASITIPDNVISIGNRAFSECRSLASITIPDSVTSIGESAFSGCSSLASITIPDRITSIGESAFQNCSSLASITIPVSVTSIGSFAFSGCSSLASITIPGSVTSIGKRAFQNCSSLANITIPDSVTSIGSFAFSDCSSLASITIPDSVTSIGKFAFSGCSKLTIYGKAGSYAQTYAKKNNIPFSTGKPGAAQGTQSLKVTKTYNKAFGDNPFKLSAKLEKGNGALTYASSAQSVATVDKKGNVTLKGTGIAIITVTAKETSEYKKADAKITITVSPAKPQAPTLKAQGGNKITVSWKADKNATGYEIQYSTDKKFKDKTTKVATVNKNKTISTTVKKLTKGKNYYVRVRAYKNATLNKKTQKLCSAWSGVKSVKVK